MASTQPEPKSFIVCVPRDKVFCSNLQILGLPDKFEAGIGVLNYGGCHRGSVTRLGNLLDSGQLFKASGNN